MRERLEAVVSGRVQMVMYRDFAMRTARDLELVGSVRNLEDGTVAVNAEGERALLESFVEKLKEGPFFARVDSVSTDWKPAAGSYDDFSIEYA